MFKRFRARRSYQYSRWDGTQRLDELDAESILDALSDDYLRHGDLRRAMERLRQMGYTNRDGQRRMGMQDLLNNLRERRKRQMQRYDMSGVMDQIQEQLERVKQLEREGIQRRLEENGIRNTSARDGQENQHGEDGPTGESSEPEPTGESSQSGPTGSGPTGAGESGQGDDSEQDALQRMLSNIANRKLAYLDQLPKDPAGQIRQLSDYDFMDDQARQAFQDLLAMLQQQVMQQYFQGMQQTLSQMTPEDLARMRQMVRELNQMLRDRAEGKEPDFDSFMQKYGDFFPGVNTLDDLIEQMQRQQMAMQAVLDSMSAEQRQQLHDMIDQLIGDDRLRVDLAELAMNLEMAMPSDARTQFQLTGDQPLSLAEAMNLMGTLQEMDELEHQMSQARRTNDVESIQGIDPEQVRDLVGDEEAEALREIQNMIKLLEEEGLVKHSGSDYELTARGIRRIGQKMLEDIFDQLDKDAFGQHRLPDHGYGGERTDETKAYVYGDAFHLQLERTLMNAVVRNGPSTPVRLERDDFEVYRTEQMTQSATVVMLDMSYSMQLNDLWQPAKKVAIALESLIRGQFPRDQLYIVGFAYLARQYQPEELIDLTEWDYAQGTNMVFGLRTAERLLAASRAVNKQIIMVTDGGPTVIEQDGEWFFTWPDTSMAELQTLREVRRCARQNISINVFMLSDDPYLKHFVNRMATVNKGRAMYSSPDHLGEYIMIDYLNNRQKHVS
jgi:uncharacterized protein with von Willebrand factor type A (vWA) domain